MSTIVNEGSLLTIVNEGLSLLRNNELYQNGRFGEKIVFQKKLTCNFIEYRLTCSFLYFLSLLLIVN